MEYYYIVLVYLHHTTTHVIFITLILKSIWHFALENFNTMQRFSNAIQIFGWEGKASDCGFRGRRSNQTEMFCLFHSEVSVVAMVTKQNLSEKVKYKQLTVIWLSMPSSQFYNLKSANWEKKNKGKEGL